MIPDQVSHFSQRSRAKGRCRFRAVRSRSPPPTKQEAITTLGREVRDTRFLERACEHDLAATDIVQVRHGPRSRTTAKCSQYCSHVSLRERFKHVQLRLLIRPRSGRREKTTDSTFFLLRVLLLMLHGGDRRYTYVSRAHRRKVIRRPFSDSSLRGQVSNSSTNNTRKNAFCNSAMAVNHAW